MSLTKPLSTDTSLLLVVDLQQTVLAAVENVGEVLVAADKIVRAAGVLGVPILWTEQAPERLGGTSSGVAAELTRLKAAYLRKTAFGCLDEPTIKEALAQAEREHVMVIGVETHICVQQTALALQRHGYSPVVCADATGSRRAFDRQVALDRLRQGDVAVSTVESVIFELLGDATAEHFKAVHEIIK